MTGEKPQIQITKDNREKRKKVALERRNPQETDDMRVRGARCCCWGPAGPKLVFCFSQVTFFS